RPRRPAMGPALREGSPRPEGAPELDPCPGLLTGRRTAGLGGGRQDDSVVGAVDGAGGAPDAGSRVRRHWTHLLPGRPDARIFQPRRHRPALGCGHWTAAQTVR